MDWSVIDWPNLAVVLALLVLVTVVLIVGPWWGWKRRAAGREGRARDAYLVDFMMRRLVYLIWSFTATVILAFWRLPAALLGLALFTGICVRYLRVRPAVLAAIESDSLLLTWRGRPARLPIEAIVKASPVFMTLVPGLWHLSLGTGLWPWRRGYLVADGERGDVLGPLLQQHHLSTRG